MKLQRKNRRALALGAFAVSGALALTACGSDDTGTSGGDSSASAGASNIKCDDAKGQLLADGSSAQKNAIDAWVKQFSAACQGVQINYKGGGSGAGVTAFNQGTVAFAGSDSALKPEEITESKKTACTDGGQGIDLPMVGGAIALAYNVEGVDNLVLDAPTIAKIFSGKIKTWDDAAVKKLNPDAKLPSTKIQAFHRSDESGTTDNFTKYLTAATSDNWKFEGGKAWTAPGGQAASGSSGVAQAVKQTSGSISYMEESYAKGMSTVAINTGASEPVKPSSDSATAAIADAKVVGTGKDLALEINYTTKADGAYPITLVTYEIVCDKGNKAETLPTVKAFLTYIASEDGQGILAENSYAPIPADIISKVRTTVAELS
ncbi:phosphate ABC transporter substrate-binding protein PstS [Streptomyces sp. cf386]|uniref:phosphate ABC transporter substrate-binding protein PstS n=1 Tax=Streptomyces sp. cf386 TaxID=1761904 RepID=UPI000B83D5AB|nr:phosphate ABC transporter substrate-binding protein PstS [Streptomyces sp. cf386]